MTTDDKTHGFMTGSATSPLSQAFPQLREALRPLRVHLTRVDDSMLGQPISASIPQAINKADFVVADITYSNPNAMYELGYAHARGKKTLIVVHGSDTAIPFDVQGYLVLRFSADDTQVFINKVRDWVASNFKRQV
jgi:nucleoside 2-deoxyribosyltransferase